MTGYLIRRMAQAIVVVLGVVLLTFLLSKLIPGGYARAALGQRASQNALANFNHLHQYDRSIFRQFWNYIWGIVGHGDLGYSFKYNQTVLSLIETKLPKTLVLVGLSTVFALLVAVPLGILQVIRRNKPIDYVLTGVSFVGYSMPAFLLGQLLILWFAIDVNWFEISPTGTSTWQILADPRGWILPVFSLSAITIAGFSRYMRSSMMETLTEDYIRTARAKGAGPARVLFRHALRNALIPIITLLGLTLPAIVGGAIITETVFNYPGMGLLTTNAATNNDVPLLIGTTFVAAIATVLGNLIADLLYAVVDPRVRYA